MSEKTKELHGVGARLRMDGFPVSATIVERSATRMDMMEKLIVSSNENKDVKNLKMQLAIAYDIINEEFMPQIGGLAIQDYARLNEFLMLAGQIKKELEND